MKIKPGDRNSVLVFGDRVFLFGEIQVETIREGEGFKVKVRQEVEVYESNALLRVDEVVFQGENIKKCLSPTWKPSSRAEVQKRIEGGERE